MARLSRSLLIDPAENGIYHCIERCVRRAFLCGDDPVTGRNFDHRKGLLQDRLEFLAGVMAIDLVGFAVMDNHAHVVVRNRPDKVVLMSDEEVARRWWDLCPGRKDATGKPLPPEPHELKMLMSDSSRLSVYRVRLSSISWLMRFLAEYVARKANREDGCTGRFWEGRFKCQRLLDEAAVLACSLYVDLNPIRAGIAETPEGSPFTSAFERIRTLQSLKDAEECVSATVDVTAVSANKSRKQWLCPVFLGTRHADMDGEDASKDAASRGFLPMTLEQYLVLLDATGRELRRDKRGVIPADCSPILERLGLSPSNWLSFVDNFGRWFHHAAGSPENMSEEAERRGCRWVAGVSRSREAYAA